MRDFARSLRTKKNNYNRLELSQRVAYRNINSTSWAQTHARNEVQLFNAFSNLLSLQHYKDVYRRESLHESFTWYTTLKKLHCWESYIAREVALLKKLARWEVCTKTLLIDAKCARHRRMLWRNVENSNAIFVYQSHVIKVHVIKSSCSSVKRIAYNQRIWLCI